MVLRALGFRKMATRYCVCTAEAVFPRKDPHWCEVCYPLVAWRRDQLQAQQRQQEKK